MVQVRSRWVVVVVDGCRERTRIHSTYTHDHISRVCVECNYKGFHTIVATIGNRNNGNGVIRAPSYWPALLNN